jgi:hypothetical protein
MAGYHFYSGGLLRMAYESADRAKRSGLDVTDETLITIVLAASAAEGFFNDIVGTIQYVAKLPGRASDPGFDRLVRISDVLAILEEENQRSVVKYQIAAKLLECREIDPSREPLQSYVQLTQLRNGIAHPKPVSTEAGEGCAKVVKSLAQRGLCKWIDDTKRNTMDAETWWVVVRTPAVAHWAATSANKIMLALANGIVGIGDFVAGGKGVLAGFRDALCPPGVAGKS